MYKLYKPSGKISIWFFPIALVVLLALVPCVGFLYSMVLWYSPSPLANVILYIIAVSMLINFCSKWCIRVGKVRNTIVAGWFAILSAILFFVTLFISYDVLNAGENGVMQVLSWDIKQTKILWIDFVERFLHPMEFITSWQSMVEIGFPIVSAKGVEFFTLKGGWFIAFCIIVIVVTVFFFVAIFYYDSRLPFCEVSNKWAKIVNLQLEYIQDKENLMKKWAFQDTSDLAELEVLRGVNCSYADVKCYVTEGNSEFYVTIKNKKILLEKNKKDGMPEFKEEDVIEFLEIDRLTGMTLLTKARSSQNEVAVKVITESSKKQNIRKLIQMVLLTIIQIGLLIYCFLQMDSVKVFMENDKVLFYIVLTLVVSLLNFVGCFIKEDVIIKNDNQYCFDETKRYQMEREDSPIGYKIYYLFMIISSIMMIVYYMKERSFL